MLSMLAKIQGKFLLSSYPSDLLARYTKEHNWYTIKKEFLVTVNAKAGNQKKKIEVLTSNYPLVHGK